MQAFPFCNYCFCNICLNFRDFASAHQLQAVFCCKLCGLHRGHTLAYQHRHPGADGLAHHIQRHPAAGVQHAFRQRKPCQHRAAHRLIQRVVSPRSSQAKTISPLCSTKQLCTARVARYSGRPACMAAVRAAPIPAASPARGTGRRGCCSTGLPSAILSVQQLATSCAAARRVGSGWRRYTCTFAPSAQTAICSTSSADAIHPSVSSRPKASCGSSAGVHTTRKAGCSFNRSGGVLCRYGGFGAVGRDTVSKAAAAPRAVVDLHGDISFLRAGAFFIHHETMTRSFMD